MDSSPISSAHSLPLPHFKESFSAIAYPLSPKDTTLPLPLPQQQRPTSKLTHSATSLQHYSYSHSQLPLLHHHQQPHSTPMSPVSVSSASPSPKPMLKRKPLVHDEAHTSTSLTSSGLPSAAAVAAFAAADVLENAADAEYHHHSTSHHRSLSHPYPPLYHHSLYTPQHQRQLSCSSVTSSAAPSPMMRRQRVSSRAQTPPRQRQLSGSSTCSSSSFSAWPCLSTPGSTCPSLMPSAAASPMAPSSLEPSVEQRKRSRTISHLDRALKEETTPHLLLAQLPPRFGSRSPSMEAAPSPLSTPRSSPSASVTSEDEAKTPSPRETAVAHRSTLDDLVYAISLDEDLTANVKQAMATMDKIASLTSSSVPAVKVTCPSSSSSSKEGGVDKLSSSTHTATVPTTTAATTFSTPNKPTATHRRRMTMGYPGENDPHAIRVVYFTPGCVDDHLARARAL